MRDGRGGGVSVYETDIISPGILPGSQRELYSEGCRFLGVKTRPRRAAMAWIMIEKAEGGGG